MLLVLKILFDVDNGDGNDFGSGQGSVFNF
jgi:hypothetical protein